VSSDRGWAAKGKSVRTAVTALTAVLASGSALAFEIDTGNPDIGLRWDNTVRFNSGIRVERRNNLIGNSAISDEGTYSFDRGDFVTNRFDLLSELDFVYKQRYGFRVSAAAWWDPAYSGTSKSNPNPPLVNIPSYPNHQYGSYTTRFYEGPSAELLDAFVFGKWDLGTVPTTLKVGRQSLYWGESLFLGGNLHGIAYAQNPLDLQKGFATPGAEAKELFRPLGQVSATAQLTDTFSVGAQYFWEWQEFRYPEGGTYTGPVDFVFNGPFRALFAQAPVNPLLGPISGQNIGFTKGPALKPKQSGDWGVALRWSPPALDGSLGFYYRRFSDKLPQTLVTQQTLIPGTFPVAALRNQPLASFSTYNLIYAGGIDLWGVSLAKNIAGVSVGAELSYRHNTPLNSQVLGAGTPAGTGVPAKGDTPGPRGDTYHGLINGVGIIPKTPVFDTANWAVELTWARWASVNSGADLFNALGYAPCAGRTKWDGCTTRDYFGLGSAFTPTWFQVFPGVDLSAPLTFAIGLYGNAPTVFGGNQANGNYTLGISANIFQKYLVDLKYIDWVGRYKDNGTAVTSVNGLTTYLTDRGFISLTLKTTF
jgi:Protein of unknown function (DUF1302)